MDIESFESLIRSEKRARKYLAGKCWKGGRVFCPRCGAIGPYHLKGERYRCGDCGYTFSDFTGRFLSRVRLSTKRWLWVIKLFELEASTKKISEQIGVSYPTALRATDAIRSGILARTHPKTFRGEVEADEAYFGGKRKGTRGRGAQGKVPVFGIPERYGKVAVEVAPDVSAETLMDSTVKKVRRGSIVYTDKFRGYDSLMFFQLPPLKGGSRHRFRRGQGVYKRPGGLLVLRQAEDGQVPWGVQGEVPPLSQGDGVQIQL